MPILKQNHLEPSKEKQEVLLLVFLNLLGVFSTTIGKGTDFSVPLYDHLYYYLNFPSVLYFIENLN